MAKEKENVSSGTKSKVRMLTFMGWAKERSVVPSALGAEISLDIDKKAKITEAEFISIMDQYGKEPSYKK